MYYYFFALSTGSVTLIVNGSGSTSVTLTSEFGNSYTRDCERTCLFEKIPAVHYSLSAKRDGYTPLMKEFILGRGESKKVVVAMEKEIALTEQRQKKEDTIAAIKLRKDIQDTIAAQTGSVILGYRNGGLYYAIPEGTKWSIYSKKDAEDGKRLFQIPSGELGSDSLDIYEGYIALKNKGDYIFYSLSNGAERAFKFSGSILGVKDTLSGDTKIITSGTGVYTYTLSDGTFSENPLYDDIIQLASGEIVALVKKTSRSKLSLLSLDGNSSDYVLLIGSDTRERKVLFQTPKNGKLLRYQDGKILFIDENDQVFVVENVK